MLPLINFKSSDAGQQFVDSLQKYGFAAFDHHPLDMALVDRIYKSWSAFFESGEADQYAMSREKQDGYFSTTVAESAKGFDEQDFKEYYHYYLWGRCPTSLQSDIKDYYEAAHTFAAKLLSWIEAYSPTEISFSEPLSNMIVGSEMTLLRILRYPGITVDEPVQRAAPHEDINLLTILPASDEPGLEILGKDGGWIAVESQPEHVLINIGDMLQEATQGFFPSTTHRVSVPAGTKTNPRMSLPLFLHPRPDVVLSERYTARSYLSERLNELGVA